MKGVSFLRTCQWAKRCGDGFKIPRNRIRVGSWGNARTEFPEETIALRSNSLILEGQKNPVKGIPSEDGEWFELVDGELRWRAWDYAKTQLGVDLDEKLGGVYCEVQSGFNDKSPIEVQIALMQLSCGTDTVPLSQYDRARSAKKLFDSGVTVEELSNRMHCSGQHVRDLLSLNSVPEKIQSGLKPSAAVRYAKADKETQKEVERRIDLGERVRVDDIKPAKHDLAASSEHVPMPPSDAHILSEEEIKEQIKKVDKMMTSTKTKASEVKLYQAMIRAWRIVLGYEMKF